MLLTCFCASCICPLSCAWLVSSSRALSSWSLNWNKMTKLWYQSLPRSVELTSTFQLPPSFLLLPLKYALAIIQWGVLPLTILMYIVENSLINSITPWKKCNQENDSSRIWLNLTKKSVGYLFADDLVFFLRSLQVDFQSSRLVFVRGRLETKQR